MVRKEQLFFPLSRIGIIGGGQLAKMMVEKGRQMGFSLAILDPTPECPASPSAEFQIVGSLYDPDKLRELVEWSDVATYDIEHIDVGVLKQLAGEGNLIRPSPRLLEIIQDKLIQKQTLAQKGIPIPPYRPVEKPDPAVFEKFGFPLVQKARHGGYDGRGVVILRGVEEMDTALQVASVIEAFIDFEKELAVMVVRGSDGQVKCYPMVEMLFEKEGNILDMLVVPAQIEESVARVAQEIAIHAVEALEGVGVFGVEMFLGREGHLYVNEVAPRPHNSGHYTIEACLTSQYEQHLRAICGFPLGSTRLLMPAVMLNLLGEPGYKGKPVIEGLRETLAIPGVSFHLYGKAETRHFRKMGHVTILDKSLKEALAKARKVKQLLKIKSETRS